jgi:GT2 family glycosyltransferase
MKLSIVIPYFQRRELLELGLISLSKQTLPEDYEILILNEGLPEDTNGILEKFINLNLRIIFTGQRNLKGIIIWRVPCYAINIGIKQAQGEFIIITCPEIYHLDNDIIPMIKELETNFKQIIITKGKDDREATFLNAVKNNSNNLNQEYDKLPNRLMTEFPFFMAMTREEFMDINGYDEEFGNGNCWDDQDFVDRMVANGNIYKELDYRIVHLYHPRLNYKLTKINNLWIKNKKLYLRRKGIIKRNIDKEWGEIDV